MLHAPQAFDEDRTMIEAQTLNNAAFDHCITGVIPADLACMCANGWVSRRIRQLKRRRPISIEALKQPKPSAAGQSTIEKK